MKQPTDFKFELGVEVRDLATGLRGSIVCRSQYLTGCNRYAVQPKLGKDKTKLPEWQYFDEDLLRATGKFVEGFKMVQKAGPPRTEAPRR